MKTVSRSVVGFGENVRRGWTVGGMVAALIWPLLTSAQTCVTPPPGLVSWWRAETNALDPTGTNHGTLVGNTDYAAGRVGQAFSFDGAGDYVSVGNPVSLQLQTFTIEAWIRRSSSTIVSYGSGGAAVLFGYGTGGYALTMDSAGVLYLGQIEVGGVSSGAAIRDTNLHHVAVTRAGSSVVLYVDGLAFPAVAYNPTFTFGTAAAIGARADNQDNSFLGVIDEISVYDRALSGTEIQAIFTAGSAGKCVSAQPPACVNPPAGLLSWWRGESDLMDEAGENNGSVVGNTSYGAGLVGQSFVFDGDHDAVSVGAATTLQLQTFTIEAWIKRASASTVSFDEITGPSGVVFAYGAGGYALSILADGRLSFSKTGVSGVQMSAGVVTGTNWHHVAVTKAGGSVAFYVDGLGYPVASSFDPGFTFTTSAAIGTRGDGGGNTFYGSIDELGIYGRALTADEIKSIYDASSAGKCTPPPLTCANAPVGLVSWWPGNGNAADVVGVNDASFVNPSFAPGEVADAFVFDGTSSYLRVPASPSLDVGAGSGFTLEAWINPADLTASGPIAEWAVAGAYAVHFYATTTLGAGELYANLVTTGGAEYVLITSGGVLTEGVHQHVALTYDKATGVARIWHNGAVVRESNIGAVTLRTSSDLYIGHRPSFSPFGPITFRGQIDEVSLYSRALSAAELQAIYAAGSAGKCVSAQPSSCVNPPSGLLSWWQAEGDAADIGAGRDGFLANGTSFAAGTVGQAFSFDGLDDSVTNALPSLTNYQDSFTIEFWAHPTLARSSTPEATSGIAGTSGQRYAIYPEFGGYGPVGVGVSVGTNGISVFEHGAVYLSSLLVYDAPILGWTHVAVVYENRQPKLFLNGQLVRMGLTSTRNPFPSTWLGGNGSPSYGNYGGLLDEVAVYARALAPNEIQAIFAAGSAGKCPIPPSITAHPASQTVTAGDGVTFTVTALGSRPLAYQWWFDATNAIAGATTASLTLASAELGDAGSYCVVVSNAAGSVTSSNAILTVNPHVCAPVSAGLVSWWRGEDNALDDVGMNDGEVLGNTTYGLGRVGRGFVFDGSGDRVVVGNPNDLRLQTFTIEAWLKRGSASVVSSGTSGAAVIFGYGAGGYALTMNSAGALGLGKIGVSGIYITKTIADTTYHHVAVTRNGSSVVFYVDGVPFAGSAYNPTFSFTTSAAVGARADNQDNSFLGTIDEIAVYNRDLTGAEIQAIYAAGSGGKCAVPATIAAQPVDQVVPAGANAMFAVAAIGSRPLSYQWWLNGIAPVAGGTNASLTLSNAQPTMDGDYTVVVSNSLNVVTSTPAHLSVRYAFASGNGQLLTNAQYTFIGPVQVQLQSYFPSSSLFYTLDGSEPDYGSRPYTGSFHVTKSATLRFITYSADFLQSWEAPPINLTIIPVYTLQAGTSGGGTVAVDPPEGPYVSNTVVNVTATPANGWSFLGWLGDLAGTDTSVAITMNRNRSVQALFGTVLSTTVAGNGAVLLMPPDGVYPYGTVVQLHAVPQVGSYFAVWGNAASGSSNPLSFTITNPSPTVSSLFAALSAGQYTLTARPDGMGQVLVSPAANRYNTGQSVTLTAVPQPGQEFLGWSGDATGTTNVLTLGVNQNPTVVASFTRRPTLSSPGGLNPEGFRLTLTGEYGAHYQVEGSTNLVDWTGLTTLTNTYGIGQFTDEAAAGLPLRFYRAVTAP